jgi:outer membrane protein assembly factor BamB
MWIMKEAPITLAVLAAAMFSADGIRAEQWPSFRGNNADGLSTGKAAPTTWNIDDGTNVKWRTPIPGLSHSSPIIWDDAIFVTAAVNTARDPELKVGLYGDIDPVLNDDVHEWRVYRVNKTTGEIVWEKMAHRGVPIMKRHPKSTHANSTPATDGKHVVAFFASEGLYCYDFDGNLIWKKDLGSIDSGFFRVKSAQWGFASSPIIHDGTVILQCDIQSNSFLAAFNVETGDELWRTARNDVPSWSTPTIYTGDGNTRIVINGFKHAGGYDFKTGKEIWRLEGNGDVPIPTPVIAHDMIFLHSAHGRMSPIYAIRTDAKGEITLDDDATTNDSIVWSIPRGGAYTATSIVLGAYVYNCIDNGVVSCFNANTGERLYRRRMGGTGTALSASPVASGGHLYYSGDEGDIFVIKAGPEFEVVAVNPLKDICMASPAVADGEIFFRTHHYLVAVADTSN